jgi:tRNA(Ile)-lysidine synthase
MDPIAAHISQAIERLGLSEQHILVAVSGGLDSCVLLHVLHALAEAAGSSGLRLTVGHINHGLRGEESEADQKDVEARAVALGLACRVTAIDVEAARIGHSSRTRPSKQEAARNLRYQALETIAHEIGAQRIATAHHLDDQAETVLMRVIRGSGVDGLAGIPEVSADGSVVRPLLRATRDEILSYAQAHGIRWREDSSNADDRYARNRLRRDWIPAITRELNPQLVRTLGNLADSHRQDAEWIAELVDDAFALRFQIANENELEILKHGWETVPEALARRLVVRAFDQLGAGRDLSRLHIERFVAFLREGTSATGGREIELPGGLRLRRLREKLVLYRKVP